MRIQWIRNLLNLAKRTAQETRIIDSWRHADGYYVKEFRPNLEQIAAELSRPGRRVYARFNPELTCGELYDPCGEILARVNLNGEFGIPHNAVVTMLSLQDSELQFFSEALSSPLRVSFVDEQIKDCIGTNTVLC